MQVTIERVGEGVLLVIGDAQVLFDTTADAQMVGVMLARVAALGGDSLDELDRPGGL